ncbi:hypothetical protein SAMN05421736_101194 [Evansella caseinilytica]|uniref:Uncharacterized protein n=1 Tax=Evansella caseinilytica TaxID=1503961 RepID=A0A1H3GJL0_9BACI|nr:hypothetical protein [Evansella caseinilytica]SDY03542.1 hypothetical protein SAMN05421736_101194 [Evansella caseinilytica]
MSDQKLDMILGVLNELRSDVNGLKDEVNGVKNDVNGLKDEVNGLKGEINGLNEKYDGLKDAVDELNDKYDEMKNDVNELKADFNEMKSDFSGLKADFIEFKNETAGRFDRLEESMKRLEVSQQEDIKSVLVQIDKKLEEKDHGLLVLNKRVFQTEVEVERLKKQVCT